MYQQDVLGSVMQVVTEERWTTVILDHLLKQDFLGVDCEGVNLGRDGTVTLVQVATPSGSVFIFDMLSKGVHNGVRTLLQSNVVKVMHDCRADVANLFAQLGNLCQTVFDTQLAQLTIDGQLTKAAKPGLNQLNERYGVPLNQMKGCINYAENPRYWAQRPLTDSMKYYAASDVLSLIQLYPKLKVLVNLPDFMVRCANKVREVVYRPEAKVNIAIAPVLQRTQVVTNAASAQTVSQSLLTQKFVTVEIKIMDGAPTGTPKLVQIGTATGNVFIFDLTSKIVLDYVRKVLESCQLLKVMHNCSTAVQSLYSHYGWGLWNMYDLQLAYRVFTNSTAKSQAGVLDIGLEALCETLGVVPYPHEVQVQEPNWFRRRPLTNAMRNRAAYDVLTLLELWPLMDAKVSRQRVLDRSFQRVIQLRRSLDQKKQTGNETQDENDDDEDSYGENEDSSDTNNNAGSYGYDYEDNYDSSSSYE